MTTETVAVLRPLGFGQLLDRAIRLYRRDFLKFLGILAIGQVPLTLMTLVSTSVTYLAPLLNLQSANPGTFRPGGSADPFAMLGPMYIGLGITFLLGIAGYFVLQTLTMPALSRAVVDSYLGKPITVIGAYRKIMPLWPTLAAAVALALVAAFIIGVFALVPCIGWIAGFGLLAFFGLGPMQILAPVMILERQQPMAGLRRAWDLCRTQFWRVVGIMAVLYLFNFLAVSGPVGLLSLLAQTILPNITGPEDLAAVSIAQFIIQSLITLVSSLLYGSLLGVCVTLLYFDLRVRQEGLDLAVNSQLAQVETMGQVDEEPVLNAIAQAPRGGRQELITWTDVANSSLLSIAIGVLYVALYSVLFFVLFAVIGTAGF